ncbi:hypothetical protein MINTM001_07750 [Mycobacterium paraintracellulare]|nr:hypothetical protein MINTM001_07750 [Mycobacterium paraintracellulare]
MVLQDENTGEFVFKRGAFKWDEDGCSCYRHSKLVENDFTWVDSKNVETNGVLRVLVSDLRANGLGIADDPHPDVPEPRPRDVAHALMVAHGLSNRERQRALSAVASRAELMPAD